MPSERKLLDLKDVEAAFWADYFFEEITCAICGCREWSSWRAKTWQGAVTPICNSCQRQFEAQKDVT